MQVIPQSKLITVGSTDPLTEQSLASSSSSDRDKKQTTQTKITVRSSYDGTLRQTSKRGDTGEAASRPKVHVHHMSDVLIFVPKFSIEVIIMLEPCPIFRDKYPMFQPHVHSTAVYSLCIRDGRC